MLQCLLLPEPERREARGLREHGGQCHREVAWMANSAARLLRGSCKSHLKVNPGHKPKLFFSANLSHLRATVCSSRRELLSPGVGLQPPRKGVCAKNPTSGALFGCLLTVFRTAVASKSRCLLEATRFYCTELSKKTCHRSRGVCCGWNVTLTT